MFKLGKLTDYAVVIMGFMGRGELSIRTVPQVAEATGIPTPTVAKILKMLVRQGLVESQRGAQGGYRLARAQQDISVAAIITAIEGPIALTACVNGGEGCSLVSFCPRRPHWDRVNKVVRQALETVTLADMTAPAGEMI